MLQTAKIAPEAGTAYDETIAGLMALRGAAAPDRRIQLVAHPLFRALNRCGTAHIYADTADIGEIKSLLVESETAEATYLYSEVDGNTTNQPLVRKVFNRYLGSDSGESVLSWVEQLKAARPGLSLNEATVALYSIINARLAHEVLGHFAAGRPWRVSLELHTGLAGKAQAAKSLGRCLSRSVPHSLVKVALTPDHPDCFLVARDLEREGIAVNFTATFSARQVVAAAMLANVHRTNIFLGRLNQGLESPLLGEQVSLRSQQEMQRLRRAYGVRTLNMLASVRRWQTMTLTAGCDAYTVPAEVLKDFLGQRMVEAEDIQPRAEEDYSAELGISEKVTAKVGAEALRRLYTVEPEFIEFLAELRSAADYSQLDGEGLFKRFDQAGFGDMFYSPSAAEWTELRKSKLPDLDSPLAKALPLDTLYTLLALGDFAKAQDEMDATIQAPIRHLFQ